VSKKNNIEGITTLNFKLHYRALLAKIAVTATKTDIRANAIK
jgi:hypothetical protein